MTVKTKWVTPKQAGEIAHIKVQRVCDLVRYGRLSYRRLGGRRIQISLESIEQFLQNKYERRINGKKLFEIEKGEYSAPAAAKLLGVTPNKIYSMIRSGLIPVTRRNTSYILQRKHLEKMFKTMYAHVPNLEFDG